MPGEPQTKKKQQPNKLKKFFSNFVSKLFKNKAIASIANRKKERELALYNAAKQEIISNFDNFTKQNAEDIMIPRSDIVAVPINISLEELTKNIAQHTHTRTLVYKGNLDNIVGFIHLKDLLKVIRNTEKYNLKKLVRKHIISPHSMKLTELLTKMRIQRTHIAVIVDEYGGTDGIVTIEDLIEEIVGTINDEHDKAIDHSYNVIQPGMVVADSRVEVEELEQVLDIKLKSEDDEFDTIGGLVMAKTGNVPKKGDVIYITENITIEVLDSTPRTLKQLKITKYNISDDEKDSPAEPKS